MKNAEIEKLISDILIKEDPHLDKKSLQLKIDGFLTALKPFGFLNKQNNKIEIREEIAERFFKSYIFFLQNEAEIINDWQRLGGEFKNPNLLFDKGVRLLSLMEKKRSEFANAKPQMKIRIVKALIVGTDQNQNEFYLTHLDDKSHFYQMIGGKIKNNESTEKAILREMYEEIPNFSLKRNEDFIIKKITEEPHISRFVSPKYGCFSEYEAHYFTVEFKKPIKLAGSMRWIKKEEYLAGMTEDGFGLIPNPKEFQKIQDILYKSQRIKPALTKAEYYTSEVEDIYVTKLNDNYNTNIENDEGIKLTIGILDDKYHFKLNHLSNGVNNFHYFKSKIENVYLFLLVFAVQKVFEKEFSVPTSLALKYKPSKFRSELVKLLNRNFRRKALPQLALEHILSEKLNNWSLIIDKNNIEIVGFSKIIEDSNLMNHLIDYIDEDQKLMG